MKEIPIEFANATLKEFGYDQIVIYARKVGAEGGEHMTTAGVTKEHCDVAATMGTVLQNYMGWNNSDYSFRPGDKVTLAYDDGDDWVSELDGHALEKGEYPEFGKTYTVRHVGKDKENCDILWLNEFPGSTIVESFEVREFKHVNTY